MIKYQEQQVTCINKFEPHRVTFQFRRSQQCRFMKLKFDNFNLQPTFYKLHRILVLELLSQHAESNLSNFKSISDNSKQQNKIYLI